MNNIRVFDSVEIYYLFTHWEELLFKRGPCKENTYVNVSGYVCKVQNVNIFLDTCTHMSVYNSYLSTIELNLTGDVRWGLCTAAQQQPAASGTKLWSELTDISCYHSSPDPTK